MKRGARRRLTRIGTKHVEHRWTEVNRGKKLSYAEDGLMRSRRLREKDD